MNLRVTQCPKCGSTFNTTAKIRTAASGLVRCGACLFVFKADEHFADGEDELDQDVFFNESDLESDSSHSISRAELNQATPEPEQLAGVPTQARSSEPPPFDLPPQTDEQQQVIGAQVENIDVGSEGDELIDFTVDTGSPNVDIAESSDLEELSDQQLHALNTVGESLEIKAAERPQIVRNVGLAAAFLLLASLVVAMLLWIRMPSLSQSPQFRPYYEIGCSILSCELPIYSDITAISSESLLASSHPDIEAALLFTIVFRNEAPFPQAFPVLTVRFTNINQELVAERDFLAVEYLPEGLQNLELMPVGNPIQVSLELVDPGEEAVNYSIAFSKPQ